MLDLTVRLCLGGGLPTLSQLKNEWYYFWHWSALQLVFFQPQTTPFDVLRGTASARGRAREGGIREGWRLSAPTSKRVSELDCQNGGMR